ncbi:hypothetical protein [Streptomyces sp. NBC_01506]|uniref:hypothetical protein n=1 Tax=Streptomyces sp. NBC_01506 TaxID=2903887 RepID=UPI00386692B5
MGGHYRSDIAAALELATDLEDSRSVRRQIRYISELIWPQEAVKLLTVGREDRQFAKSPGVVVLTNQRVVFNRSSLLGYLVTAPVDAISSVDWAGGTLKLKWPVDEFIRVRDVPEGSGTLLASRLRAQLEERRVSERLEEQRTARRRRGLPEGTENSAEDVTTRLSTLDRLREADTITEAEYQERRAAILGTI